MVKFENLWVIIEKNTGKIAGDFGIGMYIFETRQLARDFKTEKELGKDYRIVKYVGADLDNYNYPHQIDDKDFLF